MPPLVLPLHFTVAVDLNPLIARLSIDHGPNVAAKLFPNTLRQFTQLAALGQTLWRDRLPTIPGAEGRPLRLGTGPGDRMVRLNREDLYRSIACEPATVAPDGVRAAVFSKDPQAPLVEEGGQSIDLHAVLEYAPKARLSKRGHKYLYIPFHHATTSPGGYFGQRFQTAKNVLPRPVIQAMKNKQRYLVIGSRLEPSVTSPGRLVQRNVYIPRPGRLTAGELDALGISSASVEGRRLVGLLAAEESSKKMKRTAYLTIRTLSQANDKGWRIPGYAAQHIAKQTADDLQKLATPNWFNAAIQADLENLLNTAR